jgi:hypothetical protein
VKEPTGCMIVSGVHIHVCGGHVHMHVTSCVYLMACSNKAATPGIHLLKHNPHLHPPLPLPQVSPAGTAQHTYIHHSRSTMPPFHSSSADAAVYVLIYCQQRPPAHG